MSEVQQLIPHRPPFLFVDEIIDSDADHLTAKKVVPKDADFFRGHYPDYPIMPGVLISESVFQAGALLMAKRISDWEGKVPVLSRANNLKFKQAVYPGDTLELSVDFVDQVGPAYYLKGKAQVNGKTALTVEFTVMLMEPAQ